MVEQVANAEINHAQKNGKLFTAKELEDIEDRVYAQANTKVRYSHDRYAAMDKTQSSIETMGILRSKGTIYKSLENTNFKKVPHGFKSRHGRGMSGGTPNKFPFRLDNQLGSEQMPRTGSTANKTQ